MQERILGVAISSCFMDTLLEVWYAEPRLHLNMGSPDRLSAVCLGLNWTILLRLSDLRFPEVLCLGASSTVNNIQ